MKKSKVIVLSILIILFIINTILVALDCYYVFDTFIHNTVMKIQSESMDKFMHFITFLGSTGFIIAIVTILFVIFLLKKKRFHAYLTMAVIIISTVLNNVVKLIIRRNRPSYITVVENTFSYPSGHTMASASLYGFMIYLILKSRISKKYKILYSSVIILLIFLIGLSRIYLGAHFASDVIGGLILSACIITITSMYYEKKVK